MSTRSSTFKSLKSPKLTSISYDTECQRNLHGRNVVLGNDGSGLPLHIPPFFFFNHEKSPSLYRFRWWYESMRKIQQHESERTWTLIVGWSGGRHLVKVIAHKLWQLTVTNSCDDNNNDVTRRDATKGKAKSHSCCVEKNRASWWFPYGLSMVPVPIAPWPPCQQSPEWNEDGRDFEENRDTRRWWKGIC